MDPIASLREKCPNTEFFLVRMRENTGQKKLRIWTLFTQYIPTKLLKQFSKAISIPLDKLINFSFGKGIFPFSLKLASVIPVLKRGNSLECNNYRPISLTSNISKVMVNLIHQRLYMFLETNKILYKNHFGFRNKHSANMP